MTRGFSSNSQVPQVSRFHNQGRSQWRSGSRAVTAAFDDHGDRQLRFFERSNTQEPTVNTRMLFVHDHLVVLANDVALVVFFDAVSCLWLASLCIVNRHDFLGRTRLAAGVDACRFDWREHSARGAAWTSRNEAHDLPQLSRYCRR